MRVVFGGGDEGSGMSEQAANNLNTMLRKLHNWDSAHGVYAALSRNHR